ncbi:TPA: LysR substrate-binding domain-containing protein [Salmonella enterica subsp. enterica serovar Eastbourne]|uniref:LysR family transcriptional regulator n=1 Tax=Salmonella enterica subsp. enterica serovar Eastbourne TaxID=486993 RepID=A0A702BAE2_SALET|nr:LysR family transcriptional regulator [Salmonella enterica]ECA1898459.1 LysR family transcriptional regulator [Salmonella enterica subsp. enterica serovar Eastbourne]HAC6678966.1 LysR family transcriptional regulator [Salmonella enterica subsp. enterica serovar Eastbourne]HAE5116461.1 LysR family transcriptional regulator [Salmonella enterica subsp. enterica serovar Eastbourne]HDN7459949.1 LysR family transcriptional regulator [Salmonella enterica subsp. enterica serovar Eastbourne]
MRHLPKIQQIKMFNEVIRSGSIRAAARSMHLSQPALTHALKDLEHHIGATLLIRSNDGVTLTEAGKLFSIRAHLVLSELEKAAEEIELMAKNSYGHVAFGISSLFGVTVLSSVINDFKRNHSKTLITIKEAQLSTLIPNLRDGRLEFLLGTVTENMPLNDFIVEPLFDAPFCIVARKGHPLSECSTLSELSQAKWVIPETDMGYYNYIRQIIPFNSPNNSNAPVQTDSVVCIINLLMNGDFLTILTRARLNIPPFSSFLSALSVDEDLLPVSHYGLIYPKNRPLTSAANSIIERFKWHCRHYKWC